MNKKYFLVIIVLLVFWVFSFAYAESNDPKLVFTLYKLPENVTSEGLVNLVKGPDDNLWFTYHDGIGSMSVNGGFSLYEIPYQLGRTRDIVLGPDDNIWFALTGSLIGNRSSIVRFNPDHSTTIFYTPNPEYSDISLVAGPDGNIWFTEEYSGKIVRMTLDGIFTEFNIPLNDNEDPIAQKQEPINIEVGPDDALWFSIGSYKSAYGRITMEGTISTVYTKDNIFPEGVAGDSRGFIWYSDTTWNRFVRIKPDFTIDKVIQPIDSNNHHYPSNVVIMLDGTVWSVALNMIYMIDGNDHVYEMDLPDDVYSGQSLISDVDGRLWFIDSDNKQIVRVEYGSSNSDPVNTPTVVGVTPTDYSAYTPVVLPTQSPSGTDIAIGTPLVETPTVAVSENTPTVSDPHSLPYYEVYLPYIQK